MTIQNLIKKEMKARKLSPLQMATLLHVNVLTVRRWLTGKVTKPRERTKLKICKRLNIDIKKLR